MSSRARSSSRAMRGALLALVGALACALGSCADEPRRPNVLFLVVDTLRADHLSCYGYPWRTSPRLDELAGRGALFLDCTAQSSWTMPSMISLMTSQPIFHTIWRIPDAMPVLAEQFQAAGYRTGGFAANSLLHDDAGFARGFDRWDVRSDKTPHWTADDVLARATAFLDERAAADGAAHEKPPPFFLWLHFFDPHNPYTPPEVPLQRDVETVFDEGARRAIELALDQLPPDERARLAAQRAGLAADVDAYDGEIAYLDARIGALLDRLARDGELDDTIVVLVADHGETLYARAEHPKKLEEVRAHLASTGAPLGLGDYLQQEHGYWMHEELVRTPFLVAGPGIAPGQRSDALVTNLDVAPTVLELAGLPAMGRVRGRSLARQLRAGEPVPSAEIAVSWCVENMAAKTPDGRKVIYPPEDMLRKYGHTPQLYDLRADRGERAPLPVDDEARRLVDYLRRSRENDIFREYSRNQQLDPETEQRLRELGYIR